MAVNLPEMGGLLPIPGVRLAASAAGIRYQGRDDLVLIELAPGSAVAGVFTRNAFCAAPVHLCRKHLQSAASRAILINAGNANAGTGQPGDRAALKTCELAAQALGIEAQAVLPLSTGVIGEQLATAPFEAALPQLQAELSDRAWDRAARAIMTTDTQPKAVSRQIEIAGERITITGIAKGAGMIRPDMATMLAFVATDANISASDLQPMLQRVTDSSFNAITVDGDTSTNDTLLLAATGQASEQALQGAELEVFEEHLQAVCETLAQYCIRDGEGATRFISVDVQQARNTEEARQVAYTVAESPLVKTAAFAGDPNWGRILAAVGRSGIDSLDLSAVDLFLDDICLIRGGQPDPDYNEEKGAAVAQQSEFVIRVVLGRGASGARIWTCDYSYDYVKINAEYRS